MRPNKDAPVNAKNEPWAFSKDSAASLLFPVSTGHTSREASRRGSSARNATFEVDSLRVNESSDLGTTFGASFVEEIKDCGDLFNREENVELSERWRHASAMVGGGEVMRNPPSKPRSTRLVLSSQAVEESMGCIDEEEPQSQVDM